MTRKITLEDFTRIQVVSDPQLSPDGKRVAFVKRHTDVEKNKHRSEIWVSPVVGGEPRRFTGGEWSDSSPRWSPDGSQIAFLSDRQKPKNQIFLIPSDGGEARPLTRLENEGRIRGIRWSPDGSRIAFLFWETPEAYRKEKTEERQKKELPPPPRVHTRLEYRLDGFGYFDGSYWQVWIVDVATVEARALTSGPFHCGPPTWSPDSSTLAFLSDRREDGDISPAQDDLWTVPAGGGDLSLVPSGPGAKSALAWSPDGRFFAYAGNPDPRDQWGTNNLRLYLLPREGAEGGQDLTGHTDRSLGYLTLSDVHDVGAGDLIAWSGDGQQLFCAVSTFGDTRLAVVPVRGGDLALLTPEKAEMGGFSVASDGRSFAVSLGTPVAPHEIFTGALEADSPPAPLQPRTHFNEGWLQEVKIVAPEPVMVRHEEGEVHGWIIRAPDSPPGEKRPLVLYVHGGPHLQYGNILFHELQFLAAEGYVVLYTNPRGSKGYGEAHTRAINKQWGGPDFSDLMKAVDQAVSSGGIDESRMAIMGGSYGGYMTAWAIGHTDRFACAIADRLVANLHSMSGTCDFAWTPGLSFEGNAWDNAGPLLEHSPLTYAGRITTPLLLVHSDGDLRCDVGQAEELFAALRLQRKVVEFIRYPAETSHDLSRSGPPDLRLHRLRSNLQWLDRWLKT